MTALRQSGFLRQLRRLVPVALLSAAITGTAGAQQGVTKSVLLSDDPAIPNKSLAPRSKFGLFALGDLGVSGMKMTGSFGWHVTSYGPCADGFIVGECGRVLKDGTTRFSVFEINISVGAGPSQLQKIAQVFPGAAGALGGGFVGMKNELLLTGNLDVGPADGSAGRLFSGVTSTSDGSCRDHTGYLNGFVSTGFSLLAGSDCPETWGSQGFQGPKVYAESAFAALRGPGANNTFRFDWWRVPTELQAAAENAGTFSTYGTMSDHFLEALEGYGNITKIGADAGYAAPTKTGYPLGIEYRFEAFQYALPAINNAVYYRLLVINNSKKVYGGNGVDYDSLYMGLTPGWGRNQATSVYWVPSRNAVMTTEIGASGTGNCNGARTAPGTIACANVGFANGATGIVVLKSPIGDNRNKLFTTPGTAFYDPTNIHRGDTITFNHGHQCGFGACWDQTFAVNERRSYAMLSSTGVNYLDGRQPSDLSAVNFYRVFRNVDFPTRTPQFNRYVPGNWDYNKDGNPDTLFLDTCHLQGCVRTWGDTMPGTTRYTVRGSNVGGTVTAGPFSLRSGDTTAFVYAFIGAPDSASFERLVDQTTIAYNNFFLVPKPAPPPRVAYTAVTPADSTDPVVRIGFTTEAYTYRDLFLAAYANNLNNRATTELAILDSLNPNLASQILARANNGGNLAEIHVYKSCDDGRTFTADADCDGDPLVNQNGQTAGLGWRPYAVIQPGANPVFTDANVIGGRTYLYSFVTKTRGFRATVQDSVPGSPRFARELVVVDTTFSALNRNGPSVAKVYVPLSIAAGGARAFATVTNAAGVAGESPITFRFADNVSAGSYRLVFGDRFVVVDTFLVDSDRHQVGVTVQDTVASRTSAGVDTVIVRTSARYSGDAVPSIGAASQTTTQTVRGDTVFTTTTVRGTGALLINAAGEPLFISTTLNGLGFTPPDFGARPDFPGFSLFLDQTGTGNLTFERIIEPDGDTVVVGIQTGQGVALNLVEGRTTRRTARTGTYDLTFAEDAFGPGAPFRNQGVGATETAVRASLAQRCTARPADCTVADTSAATRSAIGAVVPAFATRDFVAARLPFRARNITYNPGANVIVAVPRRSAAANRLTLGTGNDTITITVPDTVWVPGDTVFFLEEFERDSIANGRVVLDAGRNPIRVTSRVVTFGPLVLDCTNTSNPRLACNPLALTDRGGTGYYDYAPGTVLRFRYQTPFNPGDSVSINVTPRQIVAQRVTEADLKKVRVVPNPFVVQSQYDVVGNTRIGDSRIIFTGVPARGSLRIYSVSGQFLQELTWTEADLNGTGDLPYDLRTREGTDLASGLYIFVVKGRGQTGGEEMARGKFVIIR